MPSFAVSRASGTPADNATTYMGHPISMDAPVAPVVVEPEPPQLTSVQEQLRQRLEAQSAKVRRGRAHG